MLMPRSSIYFLKSVWLIPQNIPCAPSKLSTCLYPNDATCFSTPFGSLGMSSRSEYNCNPNVDIRLPDHALAIFDPAKTPVARRPVDLRKFRREYILSVFFE